MKTWILPEPRGIGPSGCATGCQWNIQKQKSFKEKEEEKEEREAKKINSRNKIESILYSKGDTCKNKRQTNKLGEETPSIK